MDFKTQNKYTVHFKDGTKMESSGSSSSLTKKTVKNEFDWVSFHISKEIIAFGKSLDDIIKIEYELNYNS